MNNFNIFLVSHQHKHFVLHIKLLCSELQDTHTFPSLLYMCLFLKKKKEKEDTHTTVLTTMFVILHNSILKLDLF